MHTIREEDNKNLKVLLIIIIINPFPLVRETFSLSACSARQTISLVSGGAQKGVDGNS